jgi:hypothetical protein
MSSGVLRNVVEWVVLRRFGEHNAFIFQEQAVQEIIPIFYRNFSFVLNVERGSTYVQSDHSSNS